MISLQIDFVITAENANKFIRMYRESYAPALRRQRGYLGSTLLRIYDDELASQIAAQQTDFNFQMELLFDTEENRQSWASSADHAGVWPMAERLCKEVVWRGYSIEADDAREESVGDQ